MNLGLFYLFKTRIRNKTTCVRDKALMMETDEGDMAQSCIPGVLSKGHAFFPEFLILSRHVSQTLCAPK